MTTKKQTPASSDNTSGVEPLAKPASAPITLEEAQWLGETIHELSHRLEHAAQLGASGNRHEAAKFALASVVDFLQTCNFSYRHTTYFSQLFDALRDLEHGTGSPLLAPHSVPHSRPIDTTARWIARTLLACAVEARHSLGESLDHAAKAVCKDASLVTKTLFPGGQLRPEQQLLSVRNKMRKATPPGPRDGMHLTAWRTVMAEIEEAIKLPPQSRQARLEEVYSGLIELARKRPL